MLATGPGSPVGVDPQIRFLDVDLDIPLDLRIDEDRSKRSLAARGRVEGADAHQPMHAGLCPQIAEGVFALDLDRRAFDAGFFTGLQVEQIDLPTTGLEPAHVHAHEHLSPVVRVGATGPGVDRKYPAPVVVRSVQ